MELQRFALIFHSFLLRFVCLSFYNLVLHESWASDRNEQQLVRCQLQIFAQ